MLGKEVYARIAPSEINGVGVIAIRDIPKGTYPLKTERKIIWDRVRIDDFTPPEVQRLARILLVPEEDGMVDVPTTGLNDLPIFFYLNHSDTPNMSWDDNESETFVSIKDIKAGEELTFDYKEIGHKLVK